MTVNGQDGNIPGTYFTVTPFSGIYMMSDFFQISVIHQKDRDHSVFSKLARQLMSRKAAEQNVTSHSHLRLYSQNLQTIFGSGSVVLTVNVHAVQRLGQTRWENRIFLLWGCYRHRLARPSWMVGPLLTGFRVSRYGRPSYM